VAVEEQSNTPSNSSFSKRQIDVESMVPGPSGRIKKSSLSAQVLQNKKSGYEYSKPVEEQSNTPSNSASFSKRQIEMESLDTLSSLSRQTKNASLSAQALQSNKSGNEHINTLKQHSDTPSGSALFNKRQSEMKSMLPGPSGRVKNASLAAQALKNNTSGNEHADTLEQHSDTLSGSASFNKRQSEMKSMLSGPSGRVKNASLSAQALQSNRSGNEHINALKQHSGTPSGSASFNKRQSELKSMYIVSGPSSHSREKEWRKMHNSAKHRESTSNKSMKPQNIPWFRQWQEKAAAAGKTCAFNLLPREERNTKLEELVSEVKRKHDEALKVDFMKGLFISKLDEPGNLKVIQPEHKKNVSRKPLRPDFLVNGKPYRPRLRRPKSWATPRLYKLIIPKCEKKYGIMKARRKAEEFVIFLCEKVCNTSHYWQYNCYNYYCCWNAEVRHCDYSSMPLVLP
jgi:hypothetical protein